MGQKYYVTEDGEAAIVDLITAEPVGVVDLNRCVELLWATHGPKNLRNSQIDVQQTAWRFFADLSPNGRLWYFQPMNGHPVCGNFIMYDLATLRGCRGKA